MYAWEKEDYYASLISVYQKTPRGSWNVLSISCVHQNKELTKECFCFYRRVIIRKDLYKIYHVFPRFGTANLYVTLATIII